MSDRAPPSVPLAPGNYDRAWNDPPLFSYSQSSAAPTSTGRTSLNKRVGFPSGGPSSLPASSGPPRLHDAGAKPPSCMLPGPPIGGTSLPPPPVTDSDNTNNKVENSVTVTKNCDEVELVLFKIARDYFPSKKCDDLIVRLSVLFSNWRSDALKPRVKILISEISTLLEGGLDRLGEADQKLVTLSADHGSEGNNMTWILAIRHLLLKLKEEQQKVDGETEAVTAPL